MAGANIILKQGDVLFHEGDQSDGMYLVRQGEIVVYLEKGGSEIKLAKVSAGSMIGEMALFDRKPRSAAARAITECEITKISDEDFKKIMKQIPKWFVALMVSLSTRLRETNERLQGIENASSGKAKPLENVIKVASILGLLWHKDGVKEGKVWLLDRDTAQSEIVSTIGIAPDIVGGVVKALIDSKLVTVKLNSYKKDVLCIPNKGTVERFVKFCQKFRLDYNGIKSLPDSVMDMVNVLGDMAQESAYDSVTITLKDIITEGERRSLATETWQSDCKYMTKLGDGFILTRASAGVGVKIDRKVFPKMLAHYKILKMLDKTGVS